MLLGDLQLTHITRYLPKEEELIGFLLAVYGKQFTCKPQWRFGPFRADLYIEEKHLVVECDEHGHVSYNNQKEEARSRALNELGISVYRFNPDAPDFALAKVVADLNEILFDLSKETPDTTGKGKRCQLDLAVRLKFQRYAWIMSTVMVLKTVWSGSSRFQGATDEVAGISRSLKNRTPFTDFVMSRLPNEESQKLFALSFGEYLRRDADALEIDFDDVYRWLGIDRKDSALRLLKREFSSAEYASHIDVGNLGTAGGRPRDVYKISFNQFEELMIAAQAAEGKKARKLVLHLKRILQDYIIAEETELKRAALAEQENLKIAAIAEQARQTAKEAGRANALQQQLEGLRSQQQHLYAFRLFGNRFKRGISKDMDKRELQHKTTCPSGDMVHSVPITCKAMEKVFESAMGSRGNWVRAEEYEFTCSEEEIKIMFEVFARAEEVLRATSISDYRKLLGVLDTHLGRTTSVTSLHRESLRIKDAQDADLELVKKFVSEHIEITEDLSDKLKGAEIYKAYQEAASEGDAVMKDKPFYRRLKVALADNHNRLRWRDVAYEGVRLS